MGAIMDHPQAGALLAQLMQQAMKGNAMMSAMGQMSEEMMAFMRNMRLNDMLKMAGASVTMKDKLALNQALNAIKK